MLAVDTNTAVHDTNVTVHNTQHRLSQQGHKLDGMDSRLSDAVEFLRKLNSGSGAGSGEEARILKQMEQQALDMREIILERVSSASVTTSDMHYPLSLYGWGQEMEFHRINTEYPGLRVSSCRRRLVFCRPG